MFRQVTSQTLPQYQPTITPEEYKEDLVKIFDEIKNINKLYSPDKYEKNQVNWEGKIIKLGEFLKLLKQQEFELKENAKLQDVLKTEQFGNIDYIKDQTEYTQDQLQRDLSSLERQIREREETLLDIDSYIVSLITGQENATLNISHTNAKFVKIAEDMQKEADEEIEDYYNDLYEESEGSPNFGTALEHPEETKNKLTTDIKKHTKFKKL
jgi:hypothetical protein